MDKAFFLIAATSGLRNREIAKLLTKDIDWESGMIIPRRGEVKEDSTKRTGMTFINDEALKILKEYLKTCQTDCDMLFPHGASKDALSRRWNKASEKAGVKITPQVLRVWFCVKMQDLGVAESYIEIFCGRAPKTILARYYTPKGRRRLREVYRRANLKVLG